MGAGRMTAGLGKSVLNALEGDFFDVVAAVDRGLRNYPYFVVLEGLPAGGDHRAIEALVRALAGIGPADNAMTFTPVQVDPAEAAGTILGTRYSRTHEALAPHTDSTFMDEPHSIVAFQMVRSDEAGGGRSTIVAADDVVSELDPDTIATLREPRFALSNERLLPILWDSQSSVSMRYYRRQMDYILAQRGEESRFTPLLNMLDELLSDLAEDREFALADGEVLIFNNQKVLHGRTAMSPESGRLLYRFRAHLAASPFSPSMLQQCAP
jgi:hypothetical protein